jgi:hypothetical protein
MFDKVDFEELVESGAFHRYKSFIVGQMPDLWESNRLGNAHALEAAGPFQGWMDPRSVLLGVVRSVFDQLSRGEDVKHGCGYFFIGIEKMRSSAPIPCSGHFEVVPKRASGACPGWLRFDTCVMDGQQVVWNALTSIWVSTDIREPDFASFGGRVLDLGTWKSPTAKHTVGFHD